MPKAMMKTFGAAAIAASILGAAIATAPRGAQAAGEAVPIPDTFGKVIRLTDYE